MNKEEIKFIEENINSNTTKLLLKYDKDSNKRFLINQIGKRQKVKNKLPELSNNYNFIFPQNSLPIEQCSSESTAKIKADLFYGNSLLDLTGGLGIDSYYISKNFKTTYFVEPNLDLFNLAKINHTYFKIFNQSAEEFLEEFLKHNPTNFDLIYIDPDRRDSNNKKLFKLEDLKPNILKIKEQLEINEKIQSENILIKLSPIFEIKELKNHFESYDIILISIDNELKELLIHLHKNAKLNYKLFIINNDNLKEYNYKLLENKLDITNNYYKYLYEPNVAILKSNLQNQIANNLQLSKFNSNSHLFTKDEILSNYPGNIYQIERILNYKKKDFELNNIDSGIIKIKNFNDTLKIIKNKLNIKESNQRYLFFTKDYNNKSICIVANKINH